VARKHGGKKEESISSVISMYEKSLQFKQGIICIKFQHRLHLCSQVIVIYTTNYCHLNKEDTTRIIPFAR
jgi:hypothetical protein